MIEKLPFRIGLMCRITGIGKSGYYSWFSKRDKTDKDYDDYRTIKEVFDWSKGKYGWRMVQMKLFEKGIKMNHKKIIRIKNKYGLVTRIRRINPYKAIMKRTQEHRTFENLLNRRFEQNTPRKKLCTDITYLPFNHRIAYFSAVKDIASGEIVGWDTSQHLQMDIVLNTLRSLQTNTGSHSLKGAMIHSDQGFHYTNPEFIKAVRELDMTQSMSRRGNCIDNAPMESFFGHMKDDVDYKSCKTFDDLRLKIEEYVKYYNQERPQWKLKKMTPVAYRNHLLSHQ